MADKKISGLDPNAPLTGAEFTVLVQPVIGPRGNVKATVDELAQYINIGTVRFRGNCDLSTDLFPQNGIAGITGTGIGGEIEIGNKWFNTGGATTSLLDENGNVIPPRVTVTARVNNPRNNSAVDWLLEYAI